MGRLIILILVIVTIVMLWKAFGPGRGNSSSVGQLGRRQNRQLDQQPRAKGPDDDPDFLWNIEKERFKKRREQERLAEEEAEREKRDRLRHQRDEDQQDPPAQD